MLNLTMIPIEKTYTDVAKYYHELFELSRESCAELILRYDEDDARVRVFDHCSQAAWAALATSNILSNWQEIPATRGTIKALIGLESNDAELTQFLLKSLSINAQRSILVLCQFQIEIFIKAINNALGLNTMGGFYEQLVSLIEALDLDRSEQDKLYVAAIMRNSFHSSGIHKDYKGENKKITIGDVTYAFKHGEPMPAQTSNVFGIVNALKHSLTVMRNVVEHDLVKKHKKQIHFMGVSEF